MKKNGIGKINDPEDKSQNRRIESLLRRREALLEARDLAKDEYQLNNAPKEKAIRHYQSRLESLVLDLYTKFNSDMIETGEDYLYNEHIVTVEIPPPPGLVESMSDLAAGADLPSPKTEEIKGLLWFKDNEPVITKSFTVTTWNPPTEQTVTNQAVLDFSVLDEAVALCFEFMDEAGIDADLAAADYTGDEGPGL